ncbi:MAG: hypothetical protein K9M98_03190 [Cephaloticoccus sp.]|nr:hypothetical protein [Cephaloticoccus sp.]MCF7759487.1 hypothetical protein [Cephaloticoccus sp.]
MNSAPETPGQPDAFDIKEVRYSLREMLAEVALERESGAFGMEHVQSDDIRKAFATKPRKRRGPKT